MKFECPHCSSKAIIRDSDQLSVLVKEAKLVCQNPACGHTFIVNISVSRTLYPSRIPNKDINIPLSEHAAHYWSNKERV